MFFIETGKRRDTSGKKIIYVSKDGAERSGFTSVTDALQSVPKDNKEAVEIRIAPGVYHEKIIIDRPFVTLIGCGKNNKQTCLSYDDYANFIMEDGSKMGTFRSYSVLVDAHDVTLKNLTIENASGDSKTHGQAIALYADGDRLIVDNCRLLGHQDTLFTGPLPPKEIVKDGFIGPKQYAPRINGRQYYKNCYICGDVDFIFGSATAYFEDCVIESLRRFADGEEDVSTPQGYVTAASTPEGQEYGYVFHKCDIISGDCPEASVYLGRPWRNYARTVFIGCKFGAHIRPALFHDWNKEAARETVLYGIDNADGTETFAERADFVRLLTKEETEAFSKEKTLAGEEGWHGISFPL
ncbi:MAG: pectinesterase family protein [Eubacterium sp.]|nr:pectinesterase family protein [Eubacterium sp.]